MLRAHVPLEAVERVRLAGNVHDILAVAIHEGQHRRIRVPPYPFGYQLFPVRLAANRVRLLREQCRTAIPEVVIGLMLASLVGVAGETIAPRCGRLPTLNDLRWTRLAHTSDASAPRPAARSRVLSRHADPLGAPTSASLKARRVRLGYTQAHVAQLAGLSVGAVNYIENRLSINGAGRRALDTALRLEEVPCAEM